MQSKNEVDTKKFVFFQCKYMKCNPYENNVKGDINTTNANNSIQSRSRYTNCNVTLK